MPHLASKLIHSSCPHLENLAGQAPPCKALPCAKPLLWHTAGPQSGLNDTQLESSDSFSLQGSLCCSRNYTPACTWLHLKSFQTPNLLFTTPAYNIPSNRTWGQPQPTQCHSWTKAASTIWTGAQGKVPDNHPRKQVSLNPPCSLPALGKNPPKRTLRGTAHRKLYLTQRALFTVP